MKFSIKEFFSKYNQIRRKLRIWSHLLKKSSMENFIFLCSDIMLEVISWLLFYFFFLNLSLLVTQFSSISIPSHAFNEILLMQITLKLGVMLDPRKCVPLIS